MLLITKVEQFWHKKIISAEKMEYFQSHEASEHQWQVELKEVTMIQITTINLQGKVPDGDSLEFLRAETLVEPQKPFALIRYAINGVENKTGLVWIYISVSF